MASFPSLSDLPYFDNKATPTETETTNVECEMGNSNQKLTQNPQANSPLLSLSRNKNVDSNETREISARQGLKNSDDDFNSTDLELGGQGPFPFYHTGEDSRDQGIARFVSSNGEAGLKNDDESSLIENATLSSQPQTKGLCRFLVELDEHSHSKVGSQMDEGELFTQAGPSSMPNSSNASSTSQPNQYLISNHTESNSHRIDSESTRHIPVHPLTPPHSIRSVRFNQNARRQDTSSIDPHDWLITQADNDSDNVGMTQAVPTLTPRRHSALSTPLLSTTRLLTPRRASRNIFDEGKHLTGATDDEDDKSSESSESDESAPLTYEEMRAVRVKRNDARLVTLGLAMPDPSTPRNDSVENESQSVVCLKKHFGMIMPTKFNGLPSAENHDTNGMHPHTSIGAPENNLESRLDKIRKQYPGRDSQIFSLSSLVQTTVNATACHQNSDEVFVPPPIFVQGMAGTAKTSIVREIVQIFTAFPSNQKSANQKPPVGSAYINCATISPSSIDTLVESAFHQIVRSFEVTTQERPTNMKRKLRLRLNGLTVPEKKIRKLESQHITSVEGDEFDEAMDEEMEERIEENRRQMSQGPREDASAIRKPDSRKRTRDVKKLVLDTPNSWPAPSVTPQVQKSLFGKSSSRSHDAPVAFGRALRPLIGDTVVSSDRKGSGCAILILDHAEKLMTLAPKRTMPRIQSNYLAQMLLLPKELRLNLLVICISKSSLLHHSRVNNSVSVAKSIGSIERAVHPIHIRFPAYTDKQSFKDILQSLFATQGFCDEDDINILVENPLSRGEYRQALVSSFLDTIIQSLMGITRDVRDMIRMAHSLWSKYISPIQSNNIKQTMVIVRHRLTKQNLSAERSRGFLQQELLQHLDEKFIRHTALWIDNCLFLMNNQTRSKVDMPYLTKCLLLAGFICQHNKAEKDRQLFTNQKNDKRKSKNAHHTRDGDAENVAFAYTTWDQQRLKMLRPRAFALERMLSVFVSMVGVIQAGDNIVHPKIDGDDGDFGNILRSMGTPVAFESLAHLREVGLLREIPGTRVLHGEGRSALFAINMGSPMYCCDLDDDDAEELAQSIKFPLSDYLVN